MSIELVCRLKIIIGNAVLFNCTGQNYAALLKFCQRVLMGVMSRWVASLVQLMGDVILQLKKSTP